ncbi:MAG: hypothetical protein AAAFM81_04410 [Pseudomonadota bacterium]
MSKPGNNRLLRVAVESCAIFLSVLLAFLVEQWRDDLNEEKDALAALSLVRAELGQNLRALTEVEPKRAIMLESYQRAINDLIDNNVFPKELPNFETPVVTSIAYELATDSGAVVTVDAADLLVIARAYESIDVVRRNERFLNERNAQIRFNDGEQYLSGFIYYINRAQANEPKAISDIKNAIASLDAALEAH